MPDFKPAVLSEGGCFPSMEVDTPIGKLLLAEHVGSNGLPGLCFAGNPKEFPCGNGMATPLLEQAGRELEEYFSGSRRKFDVPLAPVGTSFQKLVWEQLRAISYGTCSCYSDIARIIGHPRSARAVGGACHSNPCLIFIPCHRVRGVNGSLIGFRGGLSLKETLLRLEGVLR